MSVRIDAAGDYLSRGASLPSVANLTVCLLFYYTTDRDAYGRAFFITDGGSNYIGFGFASDGQTLQSDIGGNTVNGAALTTGEWYHLAYTINGDTKLTYLDGSLNITHTFAQSVTPAIFTIGSDTVGFMNGRFAAIKIWEATLSADEINQERFTVRPVRTANLHGFWPVFPGSTERLADLSGNGRDFTANGTLTDEDAPPTSWGGHRMYFIPKPLGITSPTLEQEGFRFRADDGGETNATWLEAQDTNLSRGAGINTRLRIIINAAGDPDPAQFQLEYKEDSETDYRKVF